MLWVAQGKYDLALNAFLVCSLINNPSATVPIAFGRPDIKNRLHALRAMTAPGVVLAVFCAGPKSFNTAVHCAVYDEAWGSGVELKQLAYEL